MQKIKEYVFEKLEQLVDKHPTLQVFCVFDAREDTFFLKFLPGYKFNNSTKLLSDRLELRRELLIRYPEVSIGFYTEGTAIDFSNPLYTITGRDFKKEISAVRGSMSTRKGVDNYDRSTFKYS